MAARIEKAFGLNKELLLQMQATYDDWEMNEKTRNIAVSSYVAPFLRLKARDIEGWAEKHIQARSLFAVFLRKLAHSTGRDLEVVDFPGFDDAETKGWDGKIVAGAATPWIPNGVSGWEFGCGEDPANKAQKDYAARTTATPAVERKETTLVFVTPRSWSGKNEWAKRRNAEGNWKAVRAYDSSDLEQWLEQSVSAQSWFGEQLGLPNEGFRSLDEQWNRWSKVSEPELPISLFLPAAGAHKTALKSWLDGDRTEPFIVSADSKAEALAFICCAFSVDEIAADGHGDRVIVFETREALRRLVAISPGFIAVVATDDVERELGALDASIATIVVRPRNSVEVRPTVTLELPSHQTLKDALNMMGLTARADELIRESGGSPTVLRRRLAKLPALRSPSWSSETSWARMLVPMLFVGAWHADSSADREIVSLLSSCAYEDVENRITELLALDDPPVWSVSGYRGVASKIDALFAANGAITPNDIDLFFFIAEMVLSERDPALDLPEDQRPVAGWYGKTRDHSGALREGICETLVILSLHGSHLFRQRLGIDVPRQVETLIRKLLTPLTPEKLYSQSQLLPHYAEAAPNEFLAILDDDLRSSNRQIYALLEPADTGIFGSCPRSGLLWALETLAWKPEKLILVCSILARLAEKKIDDNWANTPEESLESIFRCWMPQTAAPVVERIAALEYLVARYSAQAWKICRQQFAPGSRSGSYNAKPKWRSDASGAGEPVTAAERYRFVRSALDIALKWKEHNEETLGELVTSMQWLQEVDQETIWNLVSGWADKEKNESRKQILRETIRKFALTPRAKDMKREVKDHASMAYARLTPSDIVVRHQWLFASGWVEASQQETAEEVDWLDREERIRELRISALREIWQDREFEGVQSLLDESGVPGQIGWHMAESVIPQEQRSDFIARCLDASSISRNDEFIAGFLNKLEQNDRADTVRQLAETMNDQNIVRILRDCPFEQETWRQLAILPKALEDQYWRSVNPGWMRRDADANEAVDHLLKIKRPRAAFACVHFALDELETTRLKRLLWDVATVDEQQAGSNRLDVYSISSALSILQKRGVSEEEMARLEYIYIEVLDHSAHGIPNLERQLTKSPLLYMQVLALTFKRDDGGEDPEEWGTRDAEKREGAWSMGYSLLERIKVTPGSDVSGKIDSGAFRKWIAEVRALCSLHGRAVIGDQKIGELMSKLPGGKDGVWPVEAARDALEELGSRQIAEGITIGRINARGVHFRGEGGGQERAISEQYRNWSKELSAYPYLSRTMEEIASHYDRDIAHEYSRAAVRRRLER